MIGWTTHWIDNAGRLPHCIHLSAVRRDAWIGPPRPSMSCRGAGSQACLTATRNAPDPWIRGVRRALGQEALGSADIIASEAAGDMAGPVDGATTVGLVVPAGVLQASTPPPSEAARARASRIRLNMMGGYSM